MTAEKERARAAAERRVAELQADVAARPLTPGELLGEAMTRAVIEALAGGHLEHQLRVAGWVLVPLDTATVPDPPHEWAEAALNLMDPGWVDPLGLLDELWRQAWTAGRLASAAAEAVA